MNPKDNQRRTHFEQIPVHIVKKIATVTPSIAGRVPTPDNVVVEKSSAKTEPSTIRDARRLALS